MFYHNKRLQYFTPPEQPDAIYAKKIQELIGGVFGEMTVMMQYLFQGWNCRGSAKYRDMLLDIGTEEIGHVEMLATMIAHLLDKGEFEYIENPKPLGDEPHPPLGNARLHTTSVATQPATPANSK